MKTRVFQLSPGPWQPQAIELFCWRRGSPGSLGGCWSRPVIWETQNGDPIEMELGLLVLCSEERASEAASLLPEQGWELIHLAEDKPAPCTGLGSSRSFSSSCLEVKDLFKVRTESVVSHAGALSHAERSLPSLGQCALSAQH